jgi:hypothetical protein
MGDNESSLQEINYKREIINENYYPVKSCR